MINVKKTLINLHQKFPTLDLDQLFTILDCIVEDSYFKPNFSPNWLETTISSSDKPQVRMLDDSIIAVPSYARENSSSISINN